MPLIVEDGSGLINSNSNASITAADDYFELRNRTDWAPLTDAQKTAALVTAADYLRRTYGLLWAGSRSSGLQRMDWPRYAVPAPVSYYSYANAALPGAYPSDSVPEEIINVQIELAYLVAVDGIDLDAPLTPPVIEETVGPITTKYAAGATQMMRFPSIENALLPFFGGSRNQFPIYRG